jgi:hypothetical protein
MTNEDREAASDWLMLIGAVGLFLSLFLTWSHQFSAAFLAQFGTSDLLRNVPHDPTAWQVYSAADVGLAVLAAAILLAALFGNRLARLGVLAGATAGLGFTLHALSKPPTNGANIFNPSLSVPKYMDPGTTAGLGETAAIAALVLAIAGLILSFTAD